MDTRRLHRLAQIGMLSGMMVGLAACDSSSDNDNTTEMTRQYQVTITNLTAGQPMSPALVMTHSKDWQSFKLGEPASVGVENIAESGDVSVLMTAEAGNEAIYSQQAGAGILTPGSSELFEISTTATGTLSLSVLSMLVNTNDALAAVNGKDLSTLAVGDTTELYLMTYDTGTEANSETADTIPGPAASSGNGEGFNAARDDVRDAVHIHAGVVTADDGLATSTLLSQHRWDNPVASVSIHRIE
ncbi:MAG: spondin domain-containing protein [Gammaproteobacteria bacterium]|nr:spondin domain-containing protein [Gammaproteobacteria bacterium]